VAEKFFPSVQQKHVPFLMLLLAQFPCDALNGEGLLNCFIFMVAFARE
jgi:hypothetical protein